LDDLKSRMPRRRDEEATITRVDDETPLGRCRVRAWFEDPRPDRLARHELGVSAVRWHRGVVLTDGERYALRFADGYAIVRARISPSSRRASSSCAAQKWRVSMCGATPGSVGRQPRTWKTAG
jgi:hypothetical protein